MTNTCDPISSRYNKVVRREMKEVLAPRLQALEDAVAQTNVELHEQVTIDARPATRRIDGEFAAAVLAPVLGIFTLALMNLFVPIIDGLGLRGLFFENGVNNLTVALTLGAWLLSWVGLYEAWHDRTVSRAKFFIVTIGILFVSALLFMPNVYRLLET